MKKAEVILGFFIFLGIVLFISNYPFGAVILLLAGLMLSGFYIGYGVFLFNDISLRALLTKGTSLFRDIKVQDIMLSIISSISISILIMGVLFKVLRWPFAHENLLVGFIMVVIALGFVLRNRLVNKRTVYRRLFLRLIVFGGIGLALLTQSNSIFIELKYKDYPNYIEAVKELNEDPDDILLQEKEQLEYDKMKGR